VDISADNDKKEEKEERRKKIAIQRRFNDIN